MASCALMEERNDIVMPQREKKEEKRGSIADTYVTKTLRQKAAGLVGLLAFKCCVREKNQGETKTGQQLCASSGTASVKLIQTKSLSL